MVKMTITLTNDLLMTKFTARIKKITTTANDGVDLVDDVDDDDAHDDTGDIDGRDDNC